VRRTQRPAAFPREGEKRDTRTRSNQTRKTSMTRHTQHMQLNPAKPEGFAGSKCVVCVARIEANGDPKGGPDL